MKTLSRITTGALLALLMTLVIFCTACPATQATTIEGYVTDGIDAVELALSFIPGLPAAVQPIAAAFGNAVIAGFACETNSVNESTGAVADAACGLAALLNNVPASIGGTFGKVIADIKKIIGAQSATPTALTARTATSAPALSASESAKIHSKKMALLAKIEALRTKHADVLALAAK